MCLDMCQRKLNLFVRGLFKGNQFLPHPIIQDKILPHPSFSSNAPQLAQHHPLEFPFTTFAFVCVCWCVRASLMLSIPHYADVILLFWRGQKASIRTPKFPPTPTPHTPWPKRRNPYGDFSSETKPFCDSGQPITTRRPPRPH